jgi:type II restriction/modification system DNA methylase subunit YeeA
MNTNALKRFAREARIKLLDQVSRKMDFVLTHDTAELRGKQREIEQLKKKIADLGKEKVVEMVAYTWFNRRMALRFMDANGYTIPKVVTPNPGMSNPEILQNALGGHIEPELQLDRQRLNDLLDGRTAATDPHTEAYKMLLVAACNHWHTAMPFMFERISDYIELLLPDDLLSDYSIVADIRNGMSDDDCQQEELIGWLYQFYIADKKDDVFDKLKKNIKITAENIPAATQLFTPRWIVRYMVENTLGKLWMTLRPQSRLRDHMPYYIEAPEGNELAPLPEGINGVTDITFLDPCQGSGHVLVYAFDLFTKIYEEEGYNTSEIPALILKHNLFGIDIDERAAQLAAFALTMKARSYYSRFLRKPVQPHVIALENVSEDTIRQSVQLPITVDGKKITDYKELSLYHLTQADNFGSLIQIAPEEAKAIQIQEGSIWQVQQKKLKAQAEYLSRQYHCVVTNPPYMGDGGMNRFLKDFVESYYQLAKYDLYACFINRAINFTKPFGFTSLINQHSWMYLKSYEKLRIQIVDNIFINSLIHLGPRTFPEISGEVVQSVAFTMIPGVNVDNFGVYVRLTDFKDPFLKEKEFFVKQNYFSFNQTVFKRIDGSPFAYWAPPQVIDLIINEKPLDVYAEPRPGLQTSDNERFLKYWYEVSFSNIGIGLERNDALSSKYKWFPHNKGGKSPQKWYGNNLIVINFKNDGEELKYWLENNPNDPSTKHWSRNLRNYKYYFEEGVTWSAMSSSSLTARINGKGFLFDTSGPTLFSDFNKYFCGLINSKVFRYFLDFFSQTMSKGTGDFSKVPIRFEKVDSIEQMVFECIELAKADWDSRELSWDFVTFPFLISRHNRVKDSLSVYERVSLEHFKKLHRLENQINQEFIDIYNVKELVESKISFEEVRYLSNEISFISNDVIYFDNKEIFAQIFSYSIGCSLGRYSIDKPGLILANQGETFQDFLAQIPNPSFIPDADNIIPVLEGEWFTDDIVGRFKAFLKVAFSPEHFEENLKFIEDTIGKDIRKYFVKDFYNDHIKRYKKRPIYWMFSSPKGHFKALIYMHRYQPDLCSKMLNDYLHPFISKLEAAKQTQNLLTLREDVSPRERTLALKEMDRLEQMLRDCREYEKTLFKVATQKISIDLDDGVKVNYQKFKEVLVPIKGLEKEEE